MVKKLLKYDFRSVSRLVFPFTLAVFAASLLGTVALKTMILITDDGFQPPWPAVVSIIIGGICVILIIATGLAIIAFSTGTVIMSYARYYTNCFTDEGYLTFTLPVKTSTQLHAKIINTFLWFLYSGFISVFCVFFILSFGTSSAFFNTEIYKTILDILKSVFFEDLHLYIIEYLFLGLLGVLYNIVLIFACITIGSIVAKKQKVLAAIGIYYGTNLILSIPMNIFSVFILMLNENNPAFIPHAYCILYSILFIVLGLVAYFFCRHLLQNKLNLA